jgi:mannose-1-phosphate guanylyltransferase/mannose-6-phosphate isomerase
MNWHDMGSLEAIYNNAPKDEQGNSLLGNVIALQSTGSYVSSEAQATAIIGLSDVIVINTIAGVVVAHADYAAQLETGLQHAALNFAEIAVTVHKTYRPWGHYVDLAKNMTMRIKHIYVNPYCRLSLQYHNKRQEYWIVLVGTATITLGTESYDLKIGESVHIPMAATHRLHNQTEEMLEVIEVQIGEDLSDDDIIRLEDDYNRV